MQEAQEELVEVQEEFRDQMEEAAEADREAPEAAVTVPAHRPPAALHQRRQPDRPGRPRESQPTPRAEAGPGNDPQESGRSPGEGEAAARGTGTAAAEVPGNPGSSSRFTSSRLSPITVTRLPFVKPNEYINLVLSTDIGGELLSQAERPGHSVTSSRSRSPLYLITRLEG